MIFPVQIINNTTPAISVTIADSGVPAVTYNQVNQSLGKHVYKIENLYLYSQNINQLLGTIQYQIFDSDGQQKYSSITTTIDPYQDNSFVVDVDLLKYVMDFILNGNSSLSSTILPNTYVQVKLFMRRITNSFGMNMDNFITIEKDANKPNFYNNYGTTLGDIQKTAGEIRDEISQDGTITPSLVSPTPQTLIKFQEDCKPLFMLGIAAITIGIYLYKKDD
jgi:hypothetical protein